MTLRLLVPIIPVDLHDTVRSLEGDLEGIGQTAAILRPNDEPVDDDGDIVVYAAIQLRRLVQVIGLTVDTDTDETLLAGFREQVLELAFAPTHQRGENLDPRLLGPTQYAARDLFRRLALHRPATGRAMRRPAPRPKQAQVVVDLGDGADG